MRYRATNERVPVGSEECRQKAVHAFKGREAKERVTVERLQPACSVRTIIVKQRLTETIREPGGEPPRPGIAAAGANSGDQRRRLVACPRQFQQAGHVVRAVL